LSTTLKKESEHIEFRF